jgi:ribonuclease D
VDRDRARQSSRRGGHRPRRAERVAIRDIADQEPFEELVEELRLVDQYAIDTEFHRERTYFAQLALLQIAWKGGVAIVDPLSVDVASFAKVLIGAGTAIMHAADQDLEVLERACGTGPSKLFDTQLAARFLGMSSPSLVSLVERLLGLRLEKGDQLTDWTRRPLSDAQRQYAAHDVAHLIDLTEVVTGRLVSTGRISWAEEECGALLERARHPQPPEEAWWRLRQARQLRGTARGVAQSVAAWRERRAQKIDRPVRFVLSDLALAAIAQRPPHTRTDLEHVRNLDLRSMNETLIAELLEAVRQGEALDPAAVASPPGPEGASVAKPAAALALAFTAELARSLEIDPSLLATRADVVGFLQRPSVGRLARSWRHDLVGEPLELLVEGRAALALQYGGLVLEQRTGRQIAGPIVED